MDRLISKLALAALLAFGAMGAAQAAGPTGLAPKAVAGGDTPVVNVDSRCGRHGCRDRWTQGNSSRTWHRDWRQNDWRGRDNWRGRYHYRDRYHVNPGFRLYIQPRVIPRYVQPAPVYRQTSAHVAWCHARYRSYRAWDNSWQPYHGPRRRCVSPFG